MKKFFSLMLVALVMLGVTACEQNVTIDTPKSEGLSFYAEIAMTRADLEQGYDGKWATVWEGNETLTVYSEEHTELYKFTNSIEEPNMFSCTEEGVENIVGQNIIIELTHGEDCYISDMGKKGLLISEFITKFNPTETISLNARNSFLRYTYNGEGIVTLSLEYEGTPFITNDIPGGASTYTSSNTGEQWVSFNAPDVTDGSVVSAVLSYYVDGIKSNQTVINLASGKVYNLGTIAKAEVSTLSIPGSHNSWSTSETPMYKVGKFSVAYGVEFEANSTFKVLGTDWYGGEFRIGEWYSVSTDGSNITVSEAGTYDIYCNENNSLVYTVNAGSATPKLQTRTIYMVANDWNDDSDARFEAWVWGSSISDAWYKFTKIGDELYSAVVPVDCTGAIFVRKGPEHKDYSWNQWNKTGDLTLSTENNTFTINGWNNGSGVSYGSWSNVVY